MIFKKLKTREVITKFLKEGGCMGCGAMICSCGNHPSLPLSSDSCKSLKTCGNCRQVSYCSTKCQKYDWKERHSLICANLAHLTSISTHCVQVDHPIDPYFYPIITALHEEFVHDDLVVVVSPLYVTRNIVLSVMSPLKEKVPATAQVCAMGLVKRKDFPCDKNTVLCMDDLTKEIFIRPLDEFTSFSFTDSLPDKSGKNGKGGKEGKKKNNTTLNPWRTVIRKMYRCLGCKSSDVCVQQYYRSELARGEETLVLIQDVSTVSYFSRSLLA